MADNAYAWFQSRRSSGQPEGRWTTEERHWYRSRLSRHSPRQDLRLGTPATVNHGLVDGQLVALVQAREQGPGGLLRGTEGESRRLGSATNPSDARDIQSAAKAAKRCLLGGGARACTGEALGQRLLRDPDALTRQGFLVIADRVPPAAERLTICFSPAVTSGSPESR